MGEQIVKGPSREEIARLAYGIWEAERRPSGRDVAHWLLAEQQLRASLTGQARWPRAADPAGPPGPGKRSRTVRRNRATSAEANL